MLSLCGAVAFWQIFHLERSISSELRRRRGEREEKEEKEKAPASKSKVCERRPGFLHGHILVLHCAMFNSFAYCLVGGQ